VSAVKESFEHKERSGSGEADLYGVSERICFCLKNKTNERSFSLFLFFRLASLAKEGAL